MNPRPFGYEPNELPTALLRDIGDIFSVGAPTTAHEKETTAMKADGIAVTMGRSRFEPLLRLTSL